MTDFGRGNAGGPISVVNGGIGAMFDNPPSQNILLKNSIIQSKLVPKNPPKDIRASLGLNGSSITGDNRSPIKGFAGLQGTNPSTFQ